MNKVILMGRLVRDPEVRRNNKKDAEMAIARYTLAVDRKFRRNNNNNEQTADFINCVAFDRQAEFAEKYLRKGTKMVVCGHIQTGSYTNKDGAKVYTTDVIIDEQEFAESKSASSTDTQDIKNEPAKSNKNEDFMHIDDDADEEGLPFN